MLNRDQLIELDRRHLWRPYTATEVQRTEDPFVIVRAEGARLFDLDGRSYLDGNASWWTSSLGHRHPRIVEAIKKQCDEMIHCSLAGTIHPNAVLLAEEMAQVAPKGLSRVFYSDNGSTSVEIAVKMAFQYWAQNGKPNRRKFIALSNAFHGDTVGAVSVSGIPEFRKVFGPLLFDVIHAPEPEDETGWERAVSAIIDSLRADPDSIAAVIVEPVVQGAAGMRIWSPVLLRKLREATAEVGTFLIADEVFTGFGRTGPMWACEHADVVPDILCTAKGFSAGTIPFAATLASETMFEGFSPTSDRALMHGHTFCGNAMGAAIAREVLRIYRDEEVIQVAGQRAEQLAAGIARTSQLEGVARSRSLGMVGALDLGETGYSNREIGQRVHRAARERGAYIRPLGNTVYLVPPLNIPKDDLSELLDILHDSVKAARE